MILVNLCHPCHALLHTETKMKRAKNSSNSIVINVGDDERNVIAAPCSPTACMSGSAKNVSRHRLPLPSLTGAARPLTKNSR
jgi:hypothetical protein